MISCTWHWWITGFFRDFFFIWNSHLLIHWPAVLIFPFQRFPRVCGSCKIWCKNAWDTSGQPLNPSLLPHHSCTPLLLHFGSRWKKGIWWYCSHYAWDWGGRSCHFKESSSYFTRKLLPRHSKTLPSLPPSRSLIAKNVLTKTTRPWCCNTQPCELNMTCAQTLPCRWDSTQSKWNVYNALYVTLVFLRAQSWGGGSSFTRLFDGNTLGR